MLAAPVILGIETSCDETAAAVVCAGRDVRSNIIATQHDLHEQYAGVVPEIASRAHLERITPVIRAALHEASVPYHDLDAVAVGHQPGLIGSLLVGVSAAKALAWSLGKPLIAVDHIVAHPYASSLDDNPADYPALGLVISGGHTSLFLLHSPIKLQLLGRTIDDAVGEAFDKAATILELGYPGGPAIDALARSGDPHAIQLPVADLGPDTLDFSFSGLKTALLYAVCGHPTGRGKRAAFERDASHYSDSERADFAASFQRAAIAALMQNVNRALDQYDDVKTLLVGGGVSANSLFRREAESLAKRRSISARIPPIEYCLDNAAMIAGLAAHYYHAGEFAGLSLSASASSEVAV